MKEGRPGFRIAELQISPSQQVILSNLFMTVA